MKRISIIAGIGFFLVVIVLALSYALKNGLISIPTQEKKTIVNGEGLILYRDNGFHPNFLIVKKGTKITFINSTANGMRAMWIGSDLHPTHSNYPGSSIDKCGTKEEPLIFDSCRSIPPGSVWSFIFNEIGVWGYHNHLRVSHLGTIQVVE